MSCYANWTTTSELLSDILNTLRHAFPQAFSAEFRHDLAIARHLSKYIWLTAYGLGDRDTVSHQSNSVLESAILNGGPTRTPKRLLSVLPLIRDLALSHNSFDYARAIKQICPSTVCVSFITGNETDITVAS